MRSPLSLKKSTPEIVASTKGDSRLFKKILSFGYYWPTMEADSLSFVRKCQACQLLRNQTRAPTVVLHNLSTPWPFHTWAFDMVGPLNSPSWRLNWILAAIKCYTKWVEVVALKKASASAVTNFIRENVIHRFGIPKQLLSDNGSLFINSATHQLCEEYGIDYIKSTPYYPQGNGQREATNRTLLRILSKMIYEKPKRWSDFLSIVLWAYQTSKRTSTHAMPFSLVYGAEVVVPVIVVPSALLAFTSKILDLDSLTYDVETLEERTRIRKKSGKCIKTKSAEPITKRSSLTLSKLEIWYLRPRDTFKRGWVLPSCS